MLGQRREILAVFFLSIITFGIYWLVWYYKVNAETRRHSQNVDVAPGLAVICLFTFMIVRMLRIGRLSLLADRRFAGYLV